LKELLKISNENKKNDDNFKEKLFKLIDKYKYEYASLELPFDLIFDYISYNYQLQDYKNSLEKSEIIIQKIIEEKDAMFINLKILEDNINIKENKCKDLLAYFSSLNSLINKYEIINGLAENTEKFIKLREFHKYLENFKIEFSSPPISKFESAEILNSFTLKSQFSENIDSFFREIPADTYNLKKNSTVNEVIGKKMILRKNNAFVKQIKSKILEKTAEIDLSQTFEKTSQNKNSDKDLDYFKVDNYKSSNDNISTSYKTIEDNEINKPFYNTIDSNSNDKKKNSKKDSSSSLFFTLFLNQEKNNITVNKDNFMNTISNQESEAKTTKFESPYNRTMTMNSKTANTTMNNNLLSVNLDSIDSRTNVNFNNPLNLKSQIRDSKQNSVNASMKYQKRVEKYSKVRMESIEQKDLGCCVSCI